MVCLQENVLNYISMLKAAIGVMERFSIESEVDMKIRQAKKIMKQARYLSTASDYWYRRLRDFEYKICYGFVGKKDHRITKAISLTSKKKKNENKRY